MKPIDLFCPRTSFPDIVEIMTHPWSVDQCVSLGYKKGAQIFGEKPNYLNKCRGRAENFQRKLSDLFEV
jgi:hypothetical protein